MARQDAEAFISVINASALQATMLITTIGGDTSPSGDWYVESVAVRISDKYIECVLRHVYTDRIVTSHTPPSEIVGRKIYNGGF